MAVVTSRSKGARLVVWGRELLLGMGRALAADRTGEVRRRLIRWLLRVRDKQGRLVPLAANRAQQEFERRRGRRNIVLKARQMGITTWVAAHYFLATITRTGMVTVQVAHDQRAAEDIFQIVHRFWENLPGGLREGALRRSRANVRQMVFPELDSECRVETAADAQAGRGATIHHLHATEVARWPRDAAATLASLRAAVTPEGEITLESTANGASGCFYDEWQRAEETGTTRHFFPWWWEDSYRRPAAPRPFTDEESALVRDHGLSAEQIAFRREIRAGFRGLARQEYAEDAEECFLASGNSVFDVALIEERLREVGPSGEPARLARFLPAAKGREYILGVDPAEGTAEGDFACVQVIDRCTGMQCAELHARMDPAELARQVAALAREYHHALVAVESNGPGLSVLALLGQQYEHLYSAQGKPGFRTHIGNRPELVAILGAALVLSPETLQSPRLLREMRTFVRSARGKAEAAPGAHDDCVMAMAIALKVREETSGREWKRDARMPDWATLGPKSVSQDATEG
jgi:hypothetical protein